MDYLFAFGAGLLCAVLLIRVRARSEAPEVPSATVCLPEIVTPLPVTGEASSPSPDLASPAARLQEMHAPLAAIYDASSHPRDLETHAVFHEAVTVLSSADVPTSVVIDHASGANVVLASAAWAALSQRADHHAAIAPMVRQFQHLSLWPMYYALRFATCVRERPPTGLLVLQAIDYWSQNPVVASMFAEHFDKRIELGDAPEFGEALSDTSAEHLAAAESFLRSTDHPTARLLLDLLVNWRRTTLDRTYLQTVGRFIEADPDRGLVLEHDGIREELAVAEACIASAPCRSILVVGEPRSGKTSFVLALSARAAARGWSVFEAGADSMMAGQVHIGQMEERLQRLRTELAADKRVLWYIPDFLLFASSGRHQYQSASLLDLLQPAITAGKVVIVSETTPGGLGTILQNRPALASALELVRLQPMTDGEVDRFMREFAARLSDATQISIGPQVLDTAMHLARHYLGAAHMPGSAVDLLKRTGQRVAAHQGARMEHSDILEMLSQLTGMPPLVLDDRERLDLGALRAFFAARVIGQDEALEALVDRIAMLKAGLIDPGKPIAVFLFAGPTGTGKTELAKALAEFLFGSAERLIRLDMSEFQTAESMWKIVGDAGQHSDVQSLATRVRKQPFSVVLLDEFEKAHPTMWDLFLQVFDDARLTDAMGQTCDFQHAVIILTSNLGAAIPQGLGLGFGSTGTSHSTSFSADQVMRTVHQTFRPELVNRLDAVIVFRPLSRELMRGILTRELARVLERRGLRDREWAVEWEISALDFLLDKGFSPSMGARPLKRAIDRHLLAPLAATLVEHRFPEGDQFLFVRSDGRGIQVEFVDPDATDDPTTMPGAVLDTRLTLPRMVLQAAGTSEEQSTLAAELHRLDARISTEAWISIEAGITAAMQEHGFWERPDRLRVLARYALMDRVKAAIDTAKGLEGRLRPSATNGRLSKELIMRLASRLYVIEHGIEDVTSDAPVEIVLAVQPVLDASDDPAAGAAWCERLFGMYRRWASHRRAQIDERTDRASTSRFAVISGFGAARILSPDAGLHILEYTGPRGQPARAVARVRVAPTPDDLPDTAVARHTVLMGLLKQIPVAASVVRRYRLDDAPLVRDVTHGWRTGRAELVMDGQFDLLAKVLQGE